ncbi:hypothetical protein P9112_011457 [Eukaryota sp. TZLM1-RC]
MTSDSDVKIEMASSKEPPAPNTDTIHSNSQYSNSFRNSFTFYGRDADSFFASIARKIRGNECENKASLTTFPGVFVPACANILGILLFARLSWIVGTGGLFHSLTIVSMSLLCTLLTATSMSALVTNGKIKSGGAYFGISRTLGSAPGTAVGVLFYLSNVFGCSMYILGAVEFMIDGLGLSIPGTISVYQVQLISYICLVLIAGSCFIGIRFVSSLAPVFLGIVILSIISIYLGFFIPSDIHEEFNVGFAYSNLQSNWASASDSTVSFSVLLSIFFPSCTGLLAGSNKSDTLKNPSNSIPKGTIMASLFTGFIYLSFTFICAGVYDRDSMLENRLLVTYTAFPLPTVVRYGVVFASLGAGLQALSSAPRLLYALAQDECVPFLKIFAKTTSRNEPTNAILVTTFLVGAVLISGNLDFVAPLVTHFFLLFYFSINLSTLILSILKPPSFRPDFKYFSKFSSFLGAALCLSYMFFISWILSVVTFILALLLIFYVQKRGAEKQWGDSIKGLQLQMTRDSLVSLRKVSVNSVHAKNWRPQILAVTQGKQSDTRLTKIDKGLIAFLSHLSESKGITMIYSILKEVDHCDVSSSRVVNALQQCCDEFELEAFCKAILTPVNNESFSFLCQAAGLGVLSPNCLMFPFSNTCDESVLVDRLNTAFDLQQSVLMFKGAENYYDFVNSSGNNADSEIIVFWLIYDSGLLLMLFHLLSKHPFWKGCTVRLYSIATLNDNSVQMKNDIEKLLARFRLRAKVRILELTDSSPYEYDRTVALNTRAELLSKLELERANSLEMVIESSRLGSTSVVNDGDTHLASAYAINELVKTRSRAEDLVLINLPPMNMFKEQDESLRSYVTFIRKLAEGVPQMLLVKGTGEEIVMDFL